MRLRFIGILAVLAMIMAFAAAPVAADHGGEQGEGQADCPAGTVFLHNFNQSELVVGLELTEGVFVRAVTSAGGEATSVTIENTTDQTVTIAVKGGSDQEGNSVSIAPGETSDPISVSGNPTISNLSVCAGPFTPTLSLEKVVTGTGASGTQPFSFTVNGGAAFNLTAAALALQIGAAAGEFTILEGQLPAGWSLSSIVCDSAAPPNVNLAARSVTVTVGTDEDVTCTFSNAFLQVSVNTPTLSLDKAVTSGDANTEFAFTWGVQGGTMTSIGDPLSANDPVRQLANVAGSYVITEAPLGSEWNFSGIDCVGNAATENVVGQTVTVTVGANEDVVCTFTNAPQSTLSGNPPTPPPTTAAQAPVRQGTLASSLPNTAVDGGPADQLPVVLLAAAALASLAYVAHRNIAAIKQRS